MLMSKMFLPTLRENPADADTVSGQLLIRAGFIRKLSSGLYEWLPLGLRVLKKVEEIVRQEMNAIGGLEVSLPLLLPRGLWEETGRWQVYGEELFRLTDRKGQDFCLGPTHEECITDLVRKEIRSWRQLPIMFYQFGLKYRDEIRPRFGIMRAREFYMKDAYSFHSDEPDAERYYQKVFAAYEKICQRCGFEFRAVEASSGAIGGSFSHEFMVLAEAGEEEIVACECGYGANVDKAECPRPEADKSEKEKPLARQPVHTPGKKSVEEVSNFLQEKPEKFIKTLIYLVDDKPVVALVRGDCEINENKLANVLGAERLILADEETVKKFTGAEVGFAGPINLSGLKIIADYLVPDIVNGISGANQTDYHLKNINYSRDYQAEIVADIRKVKPGDSCPHCGRELKFYRGIEVGHTFKLGTKYSRAMQATYLDGEGKEKLIVMGCYGIGVSRIVAAAVEQSHDSDGIIWPENIAPYKIIIIPAGKNDSPVTPVAEEIYEKLLKAGQEVILDDRDERVGVKFKDADLIGIPYRITVGEKKISRGLVELKKRSEEQSTDLSVAAVVNFFTRT